MEPGNKEDRALARATWLLRFVAFDNSGRCCHVAVPIDWLLFFCLGVFALMKHQWPNHGAAGKGELPLLFHIGRLCFALPQHRR
jgi:hypothetical protein